MSLGLEDVMVEKFEEVREFVKKNYPKCKVSFDSDRGGDYIILKSKDGAVLECVEFYNTFIECFKQMR